LLLSERTILEGEHGTKAEAGVHVAMAIAAREQLARQITLNVNKQVLDKLVELNWGEEQVGKVRLVQAPLVDEDKKFLQELYLAVLNDPTAFAQELASYDLDSMKDKLSVPKNDSVTGVVPVPKANEPEVPEPKAPAQKGEEEET
jgi:DNA-binding protein YbaB